MIQRQVRAGGRPVYGRVAPLSKPPKKRGSVRLQIGPMGWRLIGLAVVLVLAGWGIGQLVAVRTIKVQAPGRVGEIEAEARKLISSNLQWGNLITFDNGEFVTKMQAADPLLRSIEVRRHWLNTLEIRATLKQPSLGWSTGNQTYVLDSDGTVIGESSAGTLPVVVDGSNVPVQIGQRAVSAHFVEFVGQILPGLAGQGITVTKLDIKDTTLDLAATTKQGYRLLFDTSRGAGDELADLAAVQKLLAASKRVPAEYIDLRVAGKAYYK